MSEIYGNDHRKLQDSFGSRKIADRLNQMIIKHEFDEDAKRFIESLDMFFLSTINHNNCPTVSYKGGESGFVTVVDRKTLAFPSFDGNGMFMSMGNINNNSNVGLLFISFEKPQRLRVHGVASFSKEDPLMSKYKEADLIVRVKLTNLWQNCNRYIHKYQKKDDF
tara:strand:- start:12 stop:506 length:495 start_codon:yes stop_codon:yes gene_type:complete